MAEAPFAEHRNPNDCQALSFHCQPSLDTPNITQKCLSTPAENCTFMAGENCTPDDWVPWCINTGKSLIPLTLLFLAQKRNLLIPLELSRVMHQGNRETPINLPGR